jgi:hypothetical protein
LYDVLILTVNTSLKPYPCPAFEAIDLVSASTLLHLCCTVACAPLQDAFILTANISLEYEKAEVNAGFFYSSAEQRESLVAAERAYTDERCRRVIELKKQVRLGPDRVRRW